MEHVSIDKFITQNYADYGRYSALHRVVPGIDGLKPSGRRILITLNEIAHGKLVSTLNAIGSVQTIHPFGDQTIETTISDMARVGAIDCQGSFGVKLLEDIPAAAARYTKVGLLSDRAAYYFDLARYVPKVEGEEKMEVAYLPIPIPHALVYGSFSWSVGILSRIPAFTFNSLLDAYYADDPTLLKAQYGYDIDDSGSSLKELWEKGTGRVKLGIKVERINQDCIDIHGSGELIKPVFGLLQEMVDQGRVIISNISKKNLYIRVTKAPRVRGVDMDSVYEKCLMIASKSRTYNVQVAHNDKVITLGMRDWITITMGLYEKAFGIHKVETMKSIDKDIEVYTFLPEVGKMVMENKSDDQIKKALSISDEILSACLGKSISMLRRKDHSDKVTALQARRNAVEVQQAQDLIEKMRTVL